MRRRLYESRVYWGGGREIELLVYSQNDFQNWVRTNSRVEVWNSSKAFHTDSVTHVLELSAAALQCALYQEIGNRNQRRHSSLATLIQDVGVMSKVLSTVPTLQDHKDFGGYHLGYQTSHTHPPHCRSVTGIKSKGTLSFKRNVQCRIQFNEQWIAECLVF